MKKIKKKYVYIILLLPLILWGVVFLYFLLWRVVISSIFFVFDLSHDDTPAYLSAAKGDHKVYVMIEPTEDKDCRLSFRVDQKTYDNTLVLGKDWGRIPLVMAYSFGDSTLMVADHCRKEIKASAQSVRFVPSVPPSDDSTLVIYMYKTDPRYNDLDIFLRCRFEIGGERLRYTKIEKENIPGALYVQ